MSNRFDSISKIGACRRPVFIAHGTADSLVPFKQGEGLFAAANEPKRFVAMPGNDHNSPVTADCQLELARFIREVDP